MSKKPISFDIVLEWSQQGVVSYNPRTNQTQTFSTLEEASRNNSGSTALIAVSRRNLFLRTLRVPDAALEDVRIVVQMRMAEVFPVASSDLAFDVYTLSDVNFEGRLAVVVAMLASDLRTLKEEAKAAGLKVAAITAGVLSSELIATRLNLQTGCVISTDGNQIAIDLVSENKVVYSRLARSTTGLDTEVQRTFTLANLPESTPVVTGDIDFEGAYRRDSASPIATLTELNPAHLQIRLELPEMLAAEKKRNSSYRIRLSGILLAGSAVLATVVGMSAVDDAEKVRRAEGASKIKVDKQRKIADARGLEANKQSKFKTELEKAFVPAQKFSDIVTLAANRLPAGAWLAGCTLERGKLIQIRGTAKTSETVAEYIRALQAEPRFRDVRLVFANNAAIETNQVVQFSVSAFPVGNLPLVEFGKKKSS